MLSITHALPLRRTSMTVRESTAPVGLSGERDNVVADERDGRGRAGRPRQLDVRIDQVDGNARWLPGTGAAARPAERRRAPARSVSGPRGCATPSPTCTATGAPESALRRSAIARAGRAVARPAAIGSGRVDGAGAAGGGGSGSGGSAAGGGAGVTGAVTCGFAVSCGASTVGAGTVGDVDGGGDRRRRCGWRRGRGVGRRRSGPLERRLAVRRRFGAAIETAGFVEPRHRLGQPPCLVQALRVLVDSRCRTECRRAPAAWLPPRARTRAPRSCGFALRRRRGCARERFPAP